MANVKIRVKVTSKPGGAGAKSTSAHPVFKGAKRSGFHKTKVHVLVRIKTSPNGTTRGK